MKIPINKAAKNQKYVFANKNEIVVTDIDSIVNGGTPIDSNTGEDLGYIGITAKKIPNGVYPASENSVTGAVVDTEGCQGDEPDEDSIAGAVVDTEGCQGDEG